MELVKGEPELKDVTEDADRKRLFDEHLVYLERKAKERADRKAKKEEKKAKKDKVRALSWV